MVLGLLTMGYKGSVKKKSLCFTFTVWKKDEPIQWDLTIKTTCVKTMQFAKTFENEPREDAKSRNITFLARKGSFENLTKTGSVFKVKEGEEWQQCCSIA